jgi:hypothetical protein
MNFVFQEFLRFTEPARDRGRSALAHPSSIRSPSMLSAEIEPTKLPTIGTIPYGVYLPLPAFFVQRSGRPTLAPGNTSFVKLTIQDPEGEGIPLPLPSEGKWFIEMTMNPYEQ